MSEFQEIEEASKFSPYEDAARAIGEIRKFEGAETVKNMVAWFPTQQRQEEILGADPDTQAEFVAGSLGRSAEWWQAVNLLDIWRPQDGGTAGGALGLSQIESEDLVPYTQKVTHCVDRYLYDMVENTLHGDLSLLASKLKTFGQAYGYRGLDISRMYQTGKEPAKVEVTLPDGEVPDSGLMYLVNEAPMDMAIESTLDPEENVLHLKAIPAQEV